MSNQGSIRKEDWRSAREEAEDLMERFGPAAWTIVENRVRTAYQHRDRARQRCLARILNRRLGLACPGRQAPSPRP